METVPQKGDVTSPVTHLVETQESRVLHFPSTKSMYMSHYWFLRMKELQVRLFCGQETAGKYQICHYSLCFKRTFANNHYLLLTSKFDLLFSHSNKQDTNQEDGKFF